MYILGENDETNKQLNKHRVRSRDRNPRSPDHPKHLESPGACRMIGPFIEQCRADEARGLLPEGYTDEIIKKMEQGK